MAAPERECGNTPPCLTPESLPPELSEAPSETVGRLREDLSKFWRDARKDLSGQLHRQERAVLERLEHLERMLKQQGPLAAAHVHLHSSDACSKGSGCRAAPSVASCLDCYKGMESSCVQVAQAVSAPASTPPSPGTPPVGKNVSQRIREEIAQCSLRPVAEVKRQHTTLSTAFYPSETLKTRSARFFEGAKSYTDRHFPALDKHATLARISRSWKFSFLVAFVICLNAFSIGLRANFVVGESFAEFMNSPSHALSLNVPGWIGLLFGGFFAAECLIRTYVERSNFLFGPQWRWNAFDLFLVVCSLLEVIAETTSLSYVRTLRLLRMIHVLQVIRVLRVFDVLRHMVYAILSSLLSMVWIIMVLALMLYVYSVFLISIVGAHVQSLAKEPLQSSTSVESLDKLFGTLSRSMLTVFEGVTGGRNYHEIMQPLIGIHWIHGVAFIMFFIFIVLGVLNIVTGIFVERATELAKLDKEMTIMHQLDEMHGFVEELKSFFQKADSDSSGTISWDEFREQLQDAKVRAYFMTMGIDVQSAVRVFQMLDRKGKGTVEVKDFVEGCIRLKGAAKSIDVCMLLLDVRRLNNMLEVLMQYTEDELGALHSMLSTGQGPSGRRPSAPASPIVERLSELTLKHAQSSSFHPLAHAFNYPQAEPEREVLPPLVSGGEGQVLAGQLQARGVAYI